MLVSMFVTKGLSCMVSAWIVRCLIVQVLKLVPHKWKRLLFLGARQSVDVRQPPLIRAR